MRAALSAHLQEQKTYDTIYRLRCKDGSYKWLHAKGKAIWKRGVAMRMAGSISDISDIKTKEAELKIAKEKAEESTRIKSEFLANMSHEIRTPMNGVIGVAALMLDTPLNSKQLQYAKTIMSSAENLLENYQ